MLLGQLTKWNRHTDQLRKCIDTSDSHDTFSDSTTVDRPQEEEEEKKKIILVYYVVYGSFSATPQQSSCNDVPVYVCSLTLVLCRGVCGHSSS